MYYIILVKRTTIIIVLNYKYLYRGYNSRHTMQYIVKDMQFYIKHSQLHNKVMFYNINICTICHSSFLPSIILLTMSFIWGELFPVDPLVKLMENLIENHLATSIQSWDSDEKTMIVVRQLVPNHPSVNGVIH